MSCEDCIRLVPYKLACKRCVRARPKDVLPTGGWFDHLKERRERRRAEDQVERRRLAKVYTWDQLRGACGHHHDWCRTSGDFGWQICSSRAGEPRPSGGGWWLRCFTCNPNGYS